MQDVIPSSANSSLYTTVRKIILEYCKLRTYLHEGGEDGGDGVGAVLPPVKQGHQLHVLGQPGRGQLGGHIYLYGTL